MKSDSVFHANIRTLVQIPRTHLKVVSGAHTYNLCWNSWSRDGDRQVLGAVISGFSERWVYSLTGRHPLTSTLTHPASTHTHLCAQPHACLHSY